MRTTVCCGALAAGVAGFSGCTSGDTLPTSPPHSGIEAGYPEAASTIQPIGDGSTALLRALSPPGDPGAGKMLVTVSGERLSLGGYPFIYGSSLAADPAFVDGWEVKFDSILVTLDHIVLAETPDLNPTDQGQTGGQVAHIDGPFAVDLHRGGPLVGKGGEGEQAIAIAAIGNQNDQGGAAFDPSARYALGFDVAAASNRAFNVNLDAQGLVDYQQAIDQGYTSLYIGTAVYKGPAPEPTTEFGSLPRTVRFRLGFATPASYVNCQNPDNDPAEPFPNEEHLRGVQVRVNATAVVQLTIHTDHIFWEKLAHEQPLHFDPIACGQVGIDAPVATVDDMAGLDFRNFRCRDGRLLPPRTLVTDYSPVAGSVLYFDSNGVSPLTDYRDFMMYSVSASGHLNSDGLCAVRRHYPSPL
jgi:hypothetical protein